MQGRIIALRPHHIDRFVSYCYGFINMLDNPASIPERYGAKAARNKFFRTLKSLFEFIASGGTGEEYILVRNGIDSVCDICSKPKKKRRSCSEPDSLDLWDGSGRVMEELELRGGGLYPIKDFTDRVKQLYPDRNKR